MTHPFKHQGDVTFHAVTSFPKGAKVLTHDGSFVLRLGETTGHKHVITESAPNTMRIVEHNGKHYIELSAPATVTHEEHGPIILSPGKYRVSHEREKDWFSLAIRQVID